MYTFLVAKELHNEYQISKLVGFHQAIDETGFTRKGDAQIELFDALLVIDQNASFSMLTSLPAHASLASVWAALEKREQDNGWLRRSNFTQRVPETEITAFTLD